MCCCHFEKLRSEREQRSRGFRLFDRQQVPCTQRRPKSAMYFCPVGFPYPPNAICHNAQCTRLCVRNRIKRQFFQCCLIVSCVYLLSIFVIVEYFKNGLVLIEKGQMCRLWQYYWEEGGTLLWLVYHKTVQAKRFPVSFICRQRLRRWKSSSMPHVSYVPNAIDLSKEIFDPWMTSLGVKTALQKLRLQNAMDAAKVSSVSLSEPRR